MWADSIPPTTAWAASRTFSIAKTTLTLSARTVIPFTIHLTITWHVTPTFWTVPSTIMPNAKPVHQTIIYPLTIQHVFLTSHSVRNTLTLHAPFVLTITICPQWTLAFKTLTTVRITLMTNATIVPVGIIDRPINWVVSPTLRGVRFMWIWPVWHVLKGFIRRMIRLPVRLMWLIAWLMTTPTNA